MLSPALALAALSLLPCGPLGGSLAPAGFRTDHRLVGDDSIGAVGRRAVGGAVGCRRCGGCRRGGLRLALRDGALPAAAALRRTLLSGRLVARLMAFDLVDLGDDVVLREGRDESHRLLD